MIVLGLTGGIGMGKSTTAALFAACGVPVWDADACVHRLYEQGPVVDELSKTFPTAVVDARIDRGQLKKIVASDPTAIEKIEQIVHPAVAEDRKNFLAQATASVVLLDIPLLFETGADSAVDKIIVVSVPEDVQRARALDRGTMTECQLDTILTKQMPDAEKRAKADYVIEALTIDAARRQVDEILKELGHERDRS